jgi:hypothetical protein
LLVAVAFALTISPSLLRFFSELRITFAAAILFGASRPIGLSDGGRALVDHRRHRSYVEGPFAGGFNS